MKITDKELVLNVHHIGGIGECGPIEMLSNVGDDVLWTFYDADEDSLKDTVIGDKKCILVNKCVGGKDGKGKFNILAPPSANSVLLPAKSAERYVFILDNKVTTWGDHTRLKETIDIDMHKLDTLIEQGEIGQIDFLSVDAQGLEYEIMEGLENNFDSVLGVITEVEFTQLYEGQKLFADQSNFLMKKGFRLSTMYNPQLFNHMYYPKCQKGRGFLTIAEVLFLREPEPMFDRLKQDISEEEKKKIVVQLIKLAGSSLFFEHFDFSYDIINKLEEMKLISIDELSEKSNNIYMKYLKKLNDGTFGIRFMPYNEYQKIKKGDDIKK